MTLKSDPNIEEKLNFCLKNDMRTFEQWKIKGYFCQKYAMFELK